MLHGIGNGMAEVAMESMSSCNLKISKQYLAQSQCISPARCQAFGTLQIINICIIQFGYQETLKKYIHEEIQTKEIGNLLESLGFHGSLKIRIWCLLGI